MAKLRLAPTLALPIEFATEGVAVIGMRGSGKSNTEVRFAELLYEAGIPWCAIDPKGDWHGIRSSADGKHPGLSVPVFGGLHGDFPLDAHTGARIADLLVDEMLSAVLDVSALSKTGGLPRFLTDFCKQLMHRHQLAPHVRTVILEEAHRYIPQSVTGQTAALKEAAASVLLEGRAFGLGCWAATQRPARLHKDVLEEVGNLIVHRIGVAATNDKRTIAGWVKHYDLSDEIVDSLTSLKPGEAWVLIPDAGIVKRVQIDRRSTFDSAATPKVGAAAFRPKTMADIDATAIAQSLADVIEKAKADDPRALRARIKELECDLTTARTALAERPEPEPVVERVEVPVCDAETRDMIDAMVSTLKQQSEILGVVSARIDKFTPAESSAVPPDAVPRVVRVPKADLARIHHVPVPPRPVDTDGDGDVKITGGARRMLYELAAWPNGLTVAQWAMRAKIKKTGGTWSTYVSRLRSAGLVEQGGLGYVITAAGRDFIGVDEVVAITPDEMRASWRERLTGGARRMFDVIVVAYPDALSKDDLAERAGIEKTGGTFSTYLSRLRSNDLITEPEKGYYRASEELIE